MLSQDVILQGILDVWVFLRGGAGFEVEERVGVVEKTLVFVGVAIEVVEQEIDLQGRVQLLGLDTHSQ